ncbi:HNH endonuclease [Pleionea mediterranea]|uniref:HNH endonuclease n=1 Tax=Pleionea mediterranea TaxID=523701 RepID=A0A316FGL7_9GAMM|nr:HNH endonuclease [Pleionea mediterranea]PWK46856.1 HNH endonuclease [Pleionea mediterranea]
MENLSIFNTGVRLAEKVLGRIGVYVCPLCLKSFDANDLSEGLLSLEHVPPKSTGGKGIILTCKKCNNSSGYLFEGDFKKKNKLISAIEAVFQLSNDSPHRFKMNLSGIETDVKLQVDDGRVNIEVLRNTNDPKQISQQLSQLKIMSDGDFRGLSFNLTTSQRFKERNIELSFLKSAFLACVAKFGYSFCKSNSTDEVRKQIIYPEKDYFEGFLFRKTSEIDGENKIIYFQKRNVLLCIIDNYVVVLPIPDETLDDYNAFVEEYREINNATLNGIDHGWPSSFEGIYD